MDLLEAIGDIGVTDPATDHHGEARARVGLTRELARGRTVPRRRRSRRSRPRWLLGMSAVAVTGGAAAAVVMLAVGSGTRPTIRSTVHMTPPPATVRDAAYVVRHVRAELISLNRGAGVVTSSVDDSGSPVYHDVVYLDPRSGSLYQADTAESRGGRVLYENVDATVFVGDEEHDRTFWIDDTRHTWSAGSSSESRPAQRAPARPFRPRFAGARSTPQAVERVLSSHLERRVRTTTLDGVRALVLVGRTGIVHVTLDVDATTYQPLREIDQGWSARAHVDQVTEVLPATASNIALASRRPRIPAGYRYVAP